MTSYQDLFGFIEPICRHTLIIIDYLIFKKILSFTFSTLFLFLSFTFSCSIGTFANFKDNLNKFINFKSNLSVNTIRKFKTDCRLVVYLVVYLVG